MASMKKMTQAYDILTNYSGKNPYVYVLKKKILVNHDILTDFQIDYIIDNHDYEPKDIYKTISITRWYGEEMQTKWECEFLPEKLRIYTMIGETQQFYHCYVQYRKSVDPFLLFLPKKAIMKNFLVEDYNDLQVDFERYNNLSMSIDKNRRLKPHQEDGVKFLVSRKKCILADDMGSGKTMTLSVAAIEGNYDSVLIVCPASLKTNWKKELMWYVPEKDITIIDSFIDKKKDELETFLGYAKGKSGKKRAELLEEAKRLGKWQDNRFIIINYEILDEFYKPSHTYTEEGIKKLCETYPLLNYIYKKKSCIIVDEAHRLSNNTSIQYKVINDLIRKTNPNSIFLATGTPVTNNPLNLYYLLRLIENEITSDYEYYTNNFCEAKTFFAKGEREKWTNIFLERKEKPDWRSLSDEQKEELKVFLETHARKIRTATGSSNLDELTSKISHIYLRRVKEDFGNLPTKTIHEIPYSLTYQQKLEYNKLWDEYEKLKQEEDPEKELNKELLEGAIYRGFLSNQMTEKTIKLCDKLVSEGNKVVIGCCYDEALYTLRDYYGDKCVIYNGKMSLKQKDKAIKTFKDNDEVKVFIGNIKAAGVGITLIVSNKLIFNNMSYAASDNLQMMDRIHRIGQTKPCDIYVQYFKDTQYEHIWEISLRKEMIQNALIKKEMDK